MSVPRYGSLLETPENLSDTHLTPSKSDESEMVQIGIVTHERCQEVYALFGKRRFPQSSESTYYYEPKSGQAGKIPLCGPRNRQLWTGDGINLPGKKGVWKVTLYSPRPM